jgi:hypothetical protein
VRNIGGKILGMFGKKLDEKAKQAIFDTSSAIGSELQGRDGNPNLLGM